jgi:putative redox protein
VDPCLLCVEHTRGESDMHGEWAEYPIEVTWEGGKRFRGGAPGKPSVVVDGARQAGPSPVEVVLVGVAGCSAIDIVEILEKRRTPPASVAVRVEFARAEHPPRRLTAIRVLFQVEADTDLHHVQRAADLSFEKYCSVTHSLAPDTEISWEVELRRPGVAQAGPEARGG